MAICSGISLGAGYSCENPIQPGVDQRLVIGNLDDIDWANTVYDTERPNVVTNLALLPGKSAYAFEGVRRSNNPQYSLVPATVSVGYSHQVDFSVFDISPEQKENLESMAVKPTFAIVQNRNDVGNGDTYFEIYGLQNGLEMSSTVRIPADSETSGAFVITLITAEDGPKESKMPATYFNTDFDTTLDLVNGIVSGSNLTLNSATVESASPSDIVLTFDKSITQFGTITVGGSTVKSVLSVSIAAAVVTVTVSAPYLAGDTITVSGGFTAADGALSLSNQSVLNNIV